MWLVDWVIPSKPASEHRAFYRALKKLRNKHGDKVRMEGRSVLVAYDETAAKEIYNLALKYGKANKFWAIQDDTPKTKQNGETAHE